MGEPQVAWQASLFSAARVGFDDAFSDLTRTQLDDDVWVDHCPGWLRGPDELFAQLLREGQWRQRTLRLFDQDVLEPRLTAGWTARAVTDWAAASLEARLRAQRSGGAGVEPGDAEADPEADAEADAEPDHQEDHGEEAGTEPGDAPEQLPGPLGEIAAALSRRYGVGFDSVWVNLYRDGRDSVAWHRDRNGRVLRNPLVVTISLGARRRFVMRPRSTSAVRFSLSPGHGDLVVMGGACQHTWEHCVPKTAKAVGARMSVTIRHSR
ncbi:MAG TPA: alpha-ketoglutarate-dependent dioxygenase AlkB [Motilibacteraceae bacterium]|nr:alpha-ketoglutarate-dependent dioxygenase AlkB [Motilibacteraceae bacterium]